MSEKELLAKHEEVMAMLDRCEALKGSSGCPYDLIWEVYTLEAELAVIACGCQTPIVKGVVLQSAMVIAHRMGRGDLAKGWANTILASECGGLAELRAREMLATLTEGLAHFRNTREALLDVLADLGRVGRGPFTTAQMVAEIQKRFPCKPVSASTALTKAKKDGLIVRIGPCLWALPVKDGDSA